MKDFYLDVKQILKALRSLGIEGWRPVEENISGLFKILNVCYWWKCDHFNTFLFDCLCEVFIGHYCKAVAILIMIKIKTMITIIKVVRVASLIAGFCLLVGLAVTIGLLESPAQGVMYTWYLSKNLQQCMRANIYK